VTTSGRLDPPEYAALVTRAFTQAGVLNPLGKRQAIVLERIARGAGATKWYVLDAPDDLDALARLVRPGGLVSFHFDGRISEVRLDEAAVDRLSAIAVRDHGSVIALRRGGIELDVYFPSDRRDLDDWLKEMADPDRAFIGAFPAWDNDGVDAVTVTLPDADGEVRGHPY
jgi:hypothetical protein